MHAAFRYAVASALALACVAAVIITVGKGEQSNADDWFAVSPEVLAEVKAKAEKASSAPKDAAMSAAALQKLERIHVMKCAKKITGSDKPRKLAPELRDKVLKCANDFMPPVQTKALLAQSAKELMSAAKTPAQKKDALAVLAKSKEDSNAVKAAPKAASTPHAAVSHSASAVAKQAAAARIAKKAAGKA